MTGSSQILQRQRRYIQGILLAMVLIVVRSSWLEEEYATSRRRLQPADVGCASGSRAGFTDTALFPTVAACAGDFNGSIAYAGSLCSRGWEVCDGSTFRGLQIGYSAITAISGCFAYNSAQDCDGCFAECASSTPVIGAGNGCFDSSGHNVSCVK